MTDTEKLVRNIRSMIDKEEFRAALETVGEHERLLSSLSSPSTEHRKLSLLFARVYYLNHDSGKAAGLLSGLPGIYHDVIFERDFVFVSSQLDLMEGRPARAIERLELALSADPPRDDMFFLRFCLGKAHFWNGDYLNANLLLQSAERYYLDLEDRLMLGNVRYMLGYTAFQRSFFDQAGAFYRKAVEDFRAAGSTRQMAAAFHMTGILLYRTGKYDESRTYLSRAMDYFEETGDHYGIVEAKIALGRLGMFSGDLAAAARSMREALDTAGETAYLRGRALALEFLGEILLLEGDLDASLEHLSMAERLAVEISPGGDLSVEVYRRLGDAYLEAGRHDDAASALSRALEISRSLHDDHELGCVLRAMGRLEAARGNFESAAACFEEAISTLRMIRDHFELAATYLSASTLYVDLARAAKESRENRRSLFDTARAYTTEAAHLFDSLGLARKASECERAASRILNENGGGRGAPAAKDNLEFRDEWLLEGFVIARSTHMKKVVAEAGALAPSNIPVLITGDTGTGKEVVARLIHALSGRPEARFVALNCASIPDAVFESELFGHRRGAFTGADRDHPGLIEQATGGTLFLDEISELTVQQQAKLLRVFQEQKVRRIGESRERPVDVRIVSASNRNVDALLRSGRIRDDFYYRVLTASIGLEPLRRRRDDIKALFSWYMRQSGGETTVEDGVLEHLEGYHWPGNVRQLISVVRVLSLIGAKRGSIGIDDLPMKIRNHHILGPGSDSPSRADVLKLKEIPSIGLVKDREEIRRLVVSSLLRSNGNKTSAARELGISRSTMYRMLKSLDIG